MTTILSSWRTYHLPVSTEQARTVVDSSALSRRSFIVILQAINVVNRVSGYREDFLLLKLWFLRPCSSFVNNLGCVRLENNNNNNDIYFAKGQVHQYCRAKSHLSWQP